MYSLKFESRIDFKNLLSLYYHIYYFFKRDYDGQEWKKSFFLDFSFGRVKIYTHFCTVSDWECALTTAKIVFSAFTQSYLILLKVYTIISWN